MKSFYPSPCHSILLVLFLFAVSLTSTKAQIPVTVIETEAVELKDAELVNTDPIKVYSDTRLFKPSFYIGADYQAFKVEEHHLFFRSFDDSGSTDFFEFQDTIREIKAAYGINLGVEFVAPKAFVGFDFTYSRESRNSLATFNIGIGRTIPIKSVLLIPKVLIGFGNGKTRLGDMENSDLVIQIGDTEFFGDDVSVSIKTRLLQLVPKLDFYIPVGQKGRRIRGGVAYKLALPFSERVEYDGYSDEENLDSAKEHRSLSHEKHFVVKNGEVIIDRSNDIDEKLKTIKFSGIRFHLGFGF